jgi:asparagine synthase (glutamine-hydrolysing)
VSGIVGLLHLDGSPVDVQLLRRMVAALAFRGPDAQGVFVSGCMGFAHTLLRTTDESAYERQPFSFDGKVWITADARVDARAELVSKLKDAGRPASVAAPDVELILHAYHVWDEECVAHLLGDFAFAIWDEPQRKLFCARDHFGVKPFFYAHVGNYLILSNTLNCVRLHPSVSDRLNELAIADFLLFDYNQELDTTAFADIRRLPPGHYLAWSDGKLGVRRYWTLPTDGRTRYKRWKDYVDRLLELLRPAVRDRLRTNRIAFSMSGGLDSPAVAAIAREALLQDGRPFTLAACTAVFDRVIPDQERYYAGLAAQALEIPIDFLVADDYEPFDRCEADELRAPEPVHEPFAALSSDWVSRMACCARVAFTGYGGDPAMQPSPHFLFQLLRGLRWGTVARSVVWYLWRYHRKPPMGGVRERVRRWWGHKEPAPLPVWLNPDLVKRFDLGQRWNRFHSMSGAPHPVAPEAYRVLMGSYWPLVFERCDAALTRVPMDMRHPFFDRRVIEYLLSIPPIPWYWDKALLREAMRGVLPEVTRTRPKAPLAGDPLLEYFRKLQAHWVDTFDAEPELHRFVDRQRIPQNAGGTDAGQLWTNLRPISLNFWLRSRSVSKYE